MHRGAVPGCVIGREIFLDRDAAGQRLLFGQVRDAEPARTKDALDAVVTGEHRAHRQGEKVRHVSRLNDCTGCARGKGRTAIRKCILPIRLIAAESLSPMSICRQ